MPTFNTGHGRRQSYDSSWLSNLRPLATGISTGATAPTAANFVTGSIPFTGMRNAAYGILHLWLRIRGGEAAQLQLWARPPMQGDTDWYHIQDLNVAKPVGQHFEVKLAPPAEYRVTAPGIPDGAIVDVYYQFSH